MVENLDDRTDRLLYTLHRGLVELRLLALARGDRQSAELADALENLPEMLRAGDVGVLEEAARELARYSRRHHSHFDYESYLGEGHPGPQSPSPREVVTCDPTTRA